MDVQEKYCFEQFLSTLSDRQETLSWGHARKSDLIWIETVYSGYALRISLRVPEQHEDFIEPTYYGMGTGSHELSFTIQLRDSLQRSGRKHVINEVLSTQDSQFKKVQQIFEAVRGRTPVQYQGKASRVTAAEAIAEATNILTKL
jgi:hypothetical protein